MKKYEVSLNREKLLQAFQDDPSLVAMAEKFVSNPDSLFEAESLTLHSFLRDQAIAKIENESVVPLDGELIELITADIETSEPHLLGDHEELLTMGIGAANERAMSLVSHCFPASMSESGDIRDNLEWTLAIAARDYGEVEDLAKLIRDRILPERLRAVIADIVSGERPVKGLSNARIRGSHRALVVYSVWLWSQIRSYSQTHCEELADDMGLPPLEALSEINKWNAMVVSSFQMVYSLSESGFKKLRREMKEYLGFWG